jgi:hypothetical protein
VRCARTLEAGVASGDFVHTGDERQPSYVYSKRHRPRAQLRAHSYPSLLSSELPLARHHLRRELDENRRATLLAAKRNSVGRHPRWESSGV